MAYIGDSCLRIGDNKLYIGDDVSFIPNALVTPEVVQVSVNSYARLDAGSTYTEDDLDTIDYVWSVSISPHESAVGITSSLVISDEGRIASILLDKVGAYRIKLVAHGASGGCSAPAYADIVAVPFSSAHSDQVALDTSWIWQLLPSFWNRMAKVDRERVETLWRGLNQITASDLLEAYNIQANQSIATIQKNTIKRWSKLDLAFTPTDYEITLNKPISSIPQNVQTSNGFITSMQLLDIPDIESKQINCGATALNDSELILDVAIPKSASGSDITLTIQASSGIITLRTKAVRLTQLGSNTVVSLGNKISASVSEIQYPLRLGVALSYKNTNQVLHLLKENSAYTSKYTSVGNTAFLLNSVPSSGNDITSASYISSISVENAEGLGICAGDIIFINVHDVDKGYVRDVRLAVVGVDDDAILVNTYNTVGFEVDRLVQAFESEIYSQELVASFLDYMNSALFWDRYDRRPLGLSDEIILKLDQGFIRRYKLSIKRIVRTKRVPIDKSVVGLTKLVESIERVHYTNGHILLPHDTVKSVSRKPFDLLENLSFYVQPTAIQGGALRRSSINANVVTSSQYNFQQASIEPGDVLYIKNTAAAGMYVITGVYEISLKLDTDITFIFRNAQFLITRKFKRNNKFVVFNPQLDMAEDVIDNLWCEAQVSDNNEAVEMNFGSLLNFTYDDWQNRGLGASYYSAALGLFIARMSAPSIKGIETATAIISGIPFAENKSKIVDIKLDYEVDTTTGEVLESMMLLEELDDNDNPTGIYKTYKLPALTTMTETSTSGIAYLDDNSRRLDIGDTVSRYKALALGAYVADLYKDITSNNLRDVRDRHRFLVKINIDSTKSTQQSLSFLNDFILEIKPSYTQYMISLLKFLTDEITVQDDVSFKIKTAVFDNPYIQRNTAQVHDYFKGVYQTNDRPSFITITTNYPTDGVVQPQNNSFSTLISQSSSFMQQIHGYKIRSKQTNPNNPDLIWFRDAPTKKLYEVFSIVDDHTIRINSKLTFESVSFIIIRPLAYEMFIGAIQRSGVDGFIQFNQIDCEVAQGDLIVFDVAGAKSLEVSHSQDGLIRTIPTFTTDLNAEARVLRRSLEVRDVATITVLSTEGKLSNLDVENVQFLGLQPGDVINGNDITATITFASTSNFIYTNPALAVGSYKIVRSVDTNSDTGYQDSVDEFQKAYMDTGYIRLGPFESSFGAGSFLVPADMQGYLRAGDIVYTLNRAMEDIGEGGGVYRIVDIIDTQAQLCYNLDGSFIYSIIRQVPLRRLYIDKDGIVNTPQIDFILG